MTGGTTLGRTIGIGDVVAIGVGSSIGISIFAVLSPAAALAGPGLLLALLAAALPMACFATVYAFLSTVAPVSGASYVWPSRFIGPYPGFLIAWLRILGSTGAIVQHGVVLMLYGHAAIGVDLPPKLTMLVLFTIFYAFNLVGLRIASKLQILLTTALVLLLVGYAAAGAPSVRPDFFVPLLSHGWGGVIAAVPVLVGLFTGIEFAAEVGEEIRDVKRTIVRGLFLSALLVLLLYGAVAWVTVGTIGETALVGSEAPLITAGRGFLGAGATTIISIAALLAICTSLNGVILIFSRFLFALARNGELPSVIASVHPRWGTPWAALTLVYALSLLGMFLPNNILFLFLAVNIPTMLKYGANCLSALRVTSQARRGKPELLAGWSAWLVRTSAALGLTLAIAIALAGLSSDWRPYAILAGWGTLGSLFWLVRNRRRRV